MKATLPAILALLTFAAVARGAEGPSSTVYCANLVYGNDKTSKCFSRNFLKELGAQTHIRTYDDFVPVDMSSVELFRHPFAVMSGEGAFELTGSQRDNLRHYLLNGGFLLASAGCSSKPWQNSFSKEMEKLFPEREMVKLGPEHPIFHTVSDVSKSQYKSGSARFPDVFGLQIDGRICVVYSPDGLNDTASVEDPGCCCCGGNEVKAAKWINMNLLAFALTH